MLNDVHGIIIGGTQNFVGDECVHDYNGNLIQLLEKPAIARELSVGMIRAHGAHKIASFLREHGADIEVVDYAFSWQLEELKDLWKSRYHSKTLFLCISTIFRQSSLYLWQFVGWIRQNYPHIHIIGGTQSIDKILPYNLDWYVYGYGEYGMLELIKCLKDDTPSKIEHYKVGKRKIINCQKHYPAFPKKELSISYQDRDFIKSWEVLPMELSRGCIFECAFCSYPILGVRKDHSRDENDLYKEMLENYERWGTEHYLLSDETVNDYHEKLVRYASVIKKLPFQPKMGGYARGDLIAGRKKSWETYIEMGFMNHFYGIESLHHPSAKAIGKGMEVGKLKDGLLEFKEYAYKNNGFFAGYISLIAGLPNETYETLDEGRKWLTENWQDNYSAIGVLSLNMPVYQGKYKHIADDLANLSLIERNPEKYGYEILNQMDKRGLWQIDDIKESYYNEALHYNTPKGKEDETPKRIPVTWRNNMGMTTKDAGAWVRKNGSVGAKGTIPTWAISEFMQDPNIKWEDMMLSEDKLAAFMAYEVNTNNLTGENLNHILFEAANDSQFAKINNDVPEINGVQFTSASREQTQRPVNIKMQVIKKYRSDKINA